LVRIGQAFFTRPQLRLRDGEQIFSFAYSVARLRVMVSSPPLLIIGTEAVIPAIGLTTREAVMLTTLPPDFCASICLTTPCVA
jgi:hypothetical protein